MPDLYVPTPVAIATTSEELEQTRKNATGWRAEEVRLPASRVTDTALADLAAASAAADDGSFARVVTAIIAARAGDMKAIPSFRAAPEMIASYLRAGLIDGWIYKRGADGHMHPYLVTSVKIKESMGRGDEPMIQLAMTVDRPFGSGRRDNGRDPGAVGSSISWAKGDVSKKTPADALLAQGYVRETPELKAAYLERLARFTDIMASGFAEQFRYTGTPSLEDSWKTPNPVVNRKVVMDVKPSELYPLRDSHPSEIAMADEDDDGLLPVPVMTVTRVFDLASHVFWTANVNDLEDYVYDSSLREKLVLPDDQRELLDVLTTDLTAFTSDIIEGKSAGNVVLAKGSPGVGKTLTAEVYAELVERPLYSIHSGVLGVTAQSVREALEEAFTRAERWKAVMLLDEADVFVLERGNDITQNAVTAEFLRTLEYFNGLLFMTTNRADNIDDAIISRCAALIDYLNPGPEDARKIWVVLAKQMKLTIPDSLLDALIDGFPSISPRDMKMLLRLTARMALSRKEPMNIKLFARCAMFRGLHYRSPEDAATERAWAEANKEGSKA